LGQTATLIWFERNCWRSRGSALTSIIVRTGTEYCVPQFGHWMGTALAFCSDLWFNSVMGRPEVLSCI